MRVKELLRKLQDPPLPQLVRSLLKAKGHSRQKLDEFLEFLVLVATIGDLEQEVTLAELRDTISVFMPTEAEFYFPAIQEALEKLGRYDSSDDTPWNNETGSCPECERYFCNDTSDVSQVRMCPRCARRFWRLPKFGWRQVSSPIALDSLREQAVMLEGLPELLEPESGS